MKTLRTLFSLLAMLAFAVSLQAQTRPLEADQAFKLQETAAPDGGRAFRFDIAPGYYLYRDTFRAVTGDDATLPLQSPPGEVKDDPYFGRMEVYYDTVTLTLPGPGPEIMLYWQGCMEDSVCYPPRSRVIPASVEGGGGTMFTPAKEFGSGTPGADPAVEPRLTLAAEPGPVETLSQRGGVALVLAGFLGFGLLLVFTPCVLPMIPIVAGMVAGTTVDGQPLARRGLMLSAVYVLAMASAFAVLGAVAAWSGQNLQLALQSPVTLVIAAGLFVVLALASFDLFELALPQALTGRLGRISGRRGTVGGAAVLGFMSALIVGPCVTAPLAGALLYIAQTGDVALGAAALFALGLGQGLPLLAVGAFGPQILPRAGAWMAMVRAAFGVLFLGMAIWLLGRVLPGPVVLALWAALLTGAGVALWQRNWAPAGAVLVLAGAIQGIGAGLGAGDPLAPIAPLAARAAVAPPAEANFATVSTLAGLDQALEAAAGPALIYVTADWCTVCRSIERGPLADPVVTAALAPLARIKVDVTDFGAESQVLLDRLASVGPPTMVFLDAAQSELPGSRLIGAVDREQILASVARVQP